MDTKKLRQKILDLAIHGKLVPQDPNDEPASVLLERIRAEKERLIAEGKIKRSKKSATSDTPHYENVPFELPEGWCWCRLDSVGEIVTGSTPSKDNVDYYGGTVPFYKPTDLEQGINTIESSDSLTELGFSVSRQLPSQSILVTCIGATIGKTGLIQKRGTCNQQINAIISNDMVLPEYLYYTCISGYMQSEIIGRASATTLPILNKNKFSEIPIPVPPIQEQHRIISKIETFFSFVIELENSDKELIGSISTAKSKILDLAIHGKLVPQDANDEPASELLKRINPNAVASCDNPHYENVPFTIPSNWIWAKLGDITNYGKCTIYPVDDIDNNSWVLELEDIEKNTGRVLVKHTKAERDIKGVRHSFFEGNVLYSKLRTYLNKVLLANEDGLCTTEIIPIECTDAVYSQYLCYVLRSQYFLDYTIQCGYGVKMPRLSTSDARKASIPLPPYKEQVKISRKVNELMKALDSIAETLG